MKHVKALTQIGFTVTRISYWLSPRPALPSNQLRRSCFVPDNIHQPNWSSLRHYFFKSSLSLKKFRHLTVATLFKRDINPAAYFFFSIRTGPIDSIFKRCECILEPGICSTISLPSETVHQEDFLFSPPLINLNSRPINIFAPGQTSAISAGPPLCLRDTTARKLVHPRRRLL